MFQWLLSLFGLGGGQPVSAAPAPASAARCEPRAEVRSPPRPVAPTQGEPVAAVSEEAVRFWVGLASTRTLSDLQGLSADDRLFLSGILKLLREEKFVIPVLPRAALEIPRLLANPDTNVADYVRVLNADPALSVEVLRSANSAYYGFATPARSIRDALTRVGISQIRGLLIVSHLKGRVLQGGAFHREAGWVSELSAGLARAAKVLAAPLALSPDEAFTRGLLLHVEHFIILGAVADISRDHGRRLAPSQECLLDAFQRFGPKVRELAVKAWNLPELCTETPEQELTARRFSELRAALVAAWTGADLPREVEGAPAELVEQAIAPPERA